jgi:hypothetical protein
MSFIKDLFPENLYHSYIVEGDPDTTVFPLREALEDRGDIEARSADVLCQIYDSFTIDDSKKIKEWHSEKAIEGTKRVCIIGAKFINHDAERTLLKMIEEPKEGTHFFIVVPNSLVLLDTILSRAHVIRVDEVSNPLFKKSTEEFFKSKPKDRIELVAEIIEEHKDSVGSGGLRFSAIRLVNDLEKIVYEQFKNDKNNPEIKFKLGELAKARDYLSLPGASVKMILEHISLVL